METVEKLAAAAITLLSLTVAGCSNNQSAITESSTEDSGPVETVVGRATWYGPGLYGNKTASGEILKKGDVDCSPWTTSLGTRVKVTREDTDESVIVVINDRKPFKEGRVIDLAHGAAQVLDLDDDGEAVVSLEVLDQQTTTE